MLQGTKYREKTVVGIIGEQWGSQDVHTYVSFVKNGIYICGDNIEFPIHLKVGKK